MNDKVAVFGQRRAGVYLLSEIYNPDNVQSSVQNVGTVIPAVGSLVVDDSVTEHNVLYVVYSVDAVTFKCTLVPAVTNVNDLGDDQIITYGNNIYMVYYKHEQMQVYTLTQDLVFQLNKAYYLRSGTEGSYTYTLATVTPGAAVTANTYYEKVNKSFWEMNVDNKISVFGDTARSYTIYKGSTLTAQSLLTAVSNYYIGDNGHVVESNRIPMDKVTVVTTNGSGETVTGTARVARKCYSATQIKDDETFVVAIYDANNRLIAQITVISHEVLGISALAATQFPIEEFYVEANQYLSDTHKCYLIRGQNVSELMFYPHIRYANGDTLSDSAIDNTKLFIYGMEEVSTAISGNEYRILFKYFLGNNETAAESGTNYSIGQSGRYIYTYATIVIIDNTNTTISKIAPILKYDTNNHYQILPVKYFKNRQEPEVLTYEDWDVNGFQGDLYNSPQVLKIKAPAESTFFYNSYQVTLFNPATTTDGVLFYFRDEPSSTNNYYGKNSSTSPRPVITYETNRATGGHRFYISNATFPSVDTFLSSFYYKADPPTVGDVVPKRPTHFIIRKIDMVNKLITTVTTGPISIENWYQDLSLTSGQDIIGADNHPGSCIVEFLYHDANSSDYEHLYGVPVDVVSTSVTPEISDYRGVIYIIYNNTEMQFNYNGPATGINTARTWFYINGAVPTLVMTGSTAEVNGTYSLASGTHLPTTAQAASYTKLVGTVTYTMYKTAGTNIWKLSYTEGGTETVLGTLNNVDPTSTGWIGVTPTVTANPSSSAESPSTITLRAVQEQTGYVWELYDSVTGTITTCRSQVFTSPVIEPWNANWTNTQVVYIAKTAPAHIVTTTPLAVTVNQYDTTHVTINATVNNMAVCNFALVSPAPAGVSLLGNVVTININTYGQFVAQVLVTASNCVSVIVTININVKRIAYYNGYMWLQTTTIPPYYLSYSGSLTAINTDRTWRQSIGSGSMELKAQTNPLDSKKYWALVYTTALTVETTYSTTELTDNNQYAEPNEVAWPATVIRLSKDAPAASDTCTPIYATISGVNYTFNPSTSTTLKNTFREWLCVVDNRDVVIRSTAGVGAAILNWNIVGIGSAAIRSTTDITMFSTEDPTQVAWPAEVTRISHTAP